MKTLKNIVRILPFLVGMMSWGCQSAKAEDNGTPEGFMKADFKNALQAGDKSAILMVHFGTTHDDARSLTIEAINKKVKESFPSYEVREAYTSRIVIHRLGKRGISKQNPMQALEQLHHDGYTHIIVQPTTLLDGVEMGSLQREAEFMKLNFKEIRIGLPLLYTEEDYESVIAAISGNFASDGATLMVGHGTYTPITACYAMMDYILKQKGHEQVFVGTIEGYPSFDDALALLKKSGRKKVMLMPFMVVAGDHAKNDIAVDWKEELEKEGFEVDLFLEGLGQNAKIQDIYVRHIKFIEQYRPVDIIEKKASYSKGNM